MSLNLFFHLLTAFSSQRNYDPINRSEMDVYCTRLAQPVPEIASCTNYEFFLKYPLSVTIFCEKLLKSLCSLNLAYDQRVSRILANQICTKSLQGINTSSGLGLDLVNQIKFEYSIFCYNTKVGAQTHHGYRFVRIV